MGRFGSNLKLFIKSLRLQRDIVDGIVRSFYGDRSTINQLLGIFTRLHIGIFRGFHDIEIARLYHLRGVVVQVYGFKLDACTVIHNTLELRELSIVTESGLKLLGCQLYGQYQ